MEVKVKSQLIKFNHNWYFS